MFDSKSPVVKAVGYFIISFFALIIIISFGMPDFISRLGLDNSIVAVVNGQKVHRFDYLRYRDNRFGHLRNQNMDDLILNYYITDILLLQKARDIGFAVSDERLTHLIREEIPAFKNPQTGVFDPNLYKHIRDANHMNNKSFYETIKKDIIKDDFLSFVNMGIVVPEDDIKAEYISSNSQIQIKYAYLSNIGLKKKFSSRITVTEQEIADEIEKNIKEIKDPKSDRVRIKQKIEQRKLNEIKKELIDRINALAMKNSSFSQALSLMDAQVRYSKEFKIGEDIKENSKKGPSIPAISNSNIFLEDCLRIPAGQTSRVIESTSGLYIFTPVLKNIARYPEEADKKEIRKKLTKQTYNMIAGNLMRELQEESKIIKNLKTD